MDMCGKTLRGRIRNENLHEIVGVALIEDKIRENSLGSLDMSIIDT